MEPRKIGVVHVVPHFGVMEHTVRADHLATPSAAKPLSSRKVIE
jgi:hypothetical protein